MGKHGKNGGGGIAAATATSSGAKAHTQNGGGGKKSNGKDGGGGGSGSGASSSASGFGGYTTEIREGCVLLMRFRSRDGMNALLDPLSNAAEGVIANRLGHNFALSDTARDHVAFRKACGLTKQVKYLIATLEGDAHSIRHEMCHARYYLDPPYRDIVMQVWTGCLSSGQRDSVTSFLTRLKYDAVAHLDEFQAYLATEKPNFFGLDLSEAQQQLLASFPPGSWR